MDTRLKIPSELTWSVQTILAFSDRNSNNGGLRIIEGSHLEPFTQRENLDLSLEKNIDLEKGDMVIFNSNLYHATHTLRENYTSAWAMNTTYRCWWVKPQFDFISMFGAARINSMTDVQKTLLGFYSQPSQEANGSPSARSGYAICD